MQPSLARAAAVVLTGGASSRMGRHKPAIHVAGRAIVERVVGAVGGWPLVVVGSGAAVPEGTRVLSEEPPGGGPVAGIAAGWAALTTGTDAAGLAPSGPDVVLVLAGDLPFLTRAHLEALVAAADGSVAVTWSSTGPNWLCAAWPAELLRERLAAVGSPAGVSVRRLLGDVPRVEVRDEADVATDVDTPEDLEAARRRADGSEAPGS
ncbi:molybdenum cofactor guanylyltransferase [Intrasporangium calvum]|uniref:molybdenum cofactor guanylyltransferase n=1 Tax=Intrasporangium calvum TaxID=53358 RepID=UPI001902734E|nr:molybdenum cofactor guanylyltransferase [Intrasporangium calvum]